MQILEYQERLEMKRDMDLIRDLLLEVEGNPLYDGTKWVHPVNPSELNIKNHSREEVGYHLTMLIEEGFIKGKSGMETIPVINKLTWKGHELLDDIRDQQIWAQTKKRTEGLASVGIQFIWEIAKAEIRNKLGLP